MDANPSPPLASLGGLAKKRPCQRCEFEEGGWAWRWIAPQWQDDYRLLARSGSWLPGEPEEARPEDELAYYVRDGPTAEAILRRAKPTQTV